MDDNKFVALTAITFIFLIFVFQQRIDLIGTLLGTFYLGISTVKKSFMPAFFSISLLLVAGLFFSEWSLFLILLMVAFFGGSGLVKKKDREE
ncbi:hypothetical protein HZB89_00055 [archaeon]|nr:hypothetical protein [archaeon]